MSCKELPQPLVDGRFRVQPFRQTIVSAHECFGSFDCLLRFRRTSLFETKDL